MLHNHISLNTISSDSGPRVTSCLLNISTGVLKLVEVSHSVILKHHFGLTAKRSHLVFPHDLPEAAQNHTVCTRGFPVWHHYSHTYFKAVFYKALHCCVSLSDIDVAFWSQMSTCCVFAASLYCIYILVWTSLTFEGFILYYRCTDKT